MASQTSPTVALHQQQHAAQNARSQPNGHVQMQQPAPPGGPSQYLKQANESIWLQLGKSRTCTRTALFILLHSTLLHPVPCACDPETCVCVLTSCRQLVRDDG